MDDEHFMDENVIPDQTLEVPQARLAKTKDGALMVVEIITEEGIDPEHVAGLQLVYIGDLDPLPGVGWFYDESTGGFSPPVVEAAKPEAPAAAQAFLSAPLVVIEKTDEGWVATGSLTTGHVDPAAYDKNTTRFVPHDDPASVSGHSYDLRSKTFTPPPPPPPPTLEEVKAEALKQVFAFIGTIQSHMTAGYPNMEVAAWGQKAAEARALLDGADITQAPLLVAEAGDEAAARALAEKVAAKAMLYEHVVGLTSRTRRELEAAINAAESQEDIDTLLSQSQQKALEALATLGIHLSEGGAA